MTGCVTNGSKGDGERRGGHDGEKVTYRKDQYMLNWWSSGQEGKDYVHNLTELSLLLIVLYGDRLFNMHAE